MGLKDAINHPALFEYMDRFIQNIGPRNGAGSPFNDDNSGWMMGYYNNFVGDLSNY
jgi:hypothetical protein